MGMYIRGRVQLAIKGFKANDAIALNETAKGDEQEVEPKYKSRPSVIKG